MLTDESVARVDFESSRPRTTFCDYPSTSSLYYSSSSTVASDPTPSTELASPSPVRIHRSSDEFVKCRPVCLLLQKCVKSGVQFSFPFVDCDEAPGTDQTFVSALATVLSHLVGLASPSLSYTTRFHAVKPPDISISDYLERIYKYFGCSNECYVLSLIYLDRVVKLHDTFTVSILNVHRLLVTSVMLAAKFFDDIYYANTFYARVGGVRTREVNVLEAHFLSLLNYNLYVSTAEYDQYRRNVLAAVSTTNHSIPRLSPSASYSTDLCRARNLSTNEEQSTTSVPTRLAASLCSGHLSPLSTSPNSGNLLVTSNSVA